MIIRHARDSDAEHFESFDLGGSGSWLDEIAEIIAGLVAWRSDPHAEHRDRQVIVAIADGHVVGVTAHERLARRGGRVWDDHRNLMVTAVRGDQQRTGLARLLVESVEWLVHPSIEFSRNVFPEADETQPPEDDQSVSFALAL